ncbi:hypothetical protein [Sphingomonas sp. 3-13AW]|uniref:hypothetical protein n=1 Tax=Sphingomonas sp. 3-13AW TaxID=3050450 RepID=UPI003BB5EDFB
MAAKLEIVELPKLANSQAAMVAAYRASLILIESGWMRYPAARWDQPAIVVMAGEVCAGGISYSEDRDDLALNVDFAFAAPDYPGALALLLTRLRGKLAGSGLHEVRFSCHEGNELMARAVRILGAKPHSHAYRVPLSALSRSSRQATAPPQGEGPGRWEMLGQAIQRNKWGWK